MPLIVVCAAWGIFWGVWAAVLPAIKEQLELTTGELGLVLSAVPVGAIPAMALAGRLARGRERAAMITVTLLFCLAVVAVAVAGAGGPPYRMGVALLLLGAASGALDVTLNLATGRAERHTGRRLFQAVYAAFPVAVIVAAPWPASPASTVSPRRPSCWPPPRSAARPSCPCARVRRACPALIRPPRPPAGGTAPWPLACWPRAFW